MNEQKPVLHRSRSAFAPAALAGILLAVAFPAGAAWERAHGDGANTGFADVITAPAGKGSRTVPGLGTFAPGAGPVIAPDGTVYIGARQGKLIALRPDGSPFWSRDITRLQEILASPAVGADGSIYVVGVKTVREHFGGKTVTRSESMLHKFTPSGGWVQQIPFPQHGGRGFTSAPPNIWRSGGVEVVMVPAHYKDPNTPSSQLRLVAFSTDGAILADQRVTSFSQTVTGGSGWPSWYLGACLATFGIVCALPPQEFTSPQPPPPADPADRLPARTVPPLPGVAIFTFAGGGTPHVVVSDHVHDVVGFTFAAGAGFRETFRARDPARVLTSPPMVLPDGHTVVGTVGKADGAIVFAGPNLNKLPAVTGLRAIYGAPTRTADGRIMAVETRTSGGGFAILRESGLVSRTDLPGQSIVSAAASRTHVFIATAGAFSTHDARTMQQVSRIDWVGGGVSTPAIGPQGHVYAVASNILFIFPPPKVLPQVQPR
jgi:hypothetical protein